MVLNNNLSSIKDMDRDRDGDRDNMNMNMDIGMGMGMGMDMGMNMNMNMNMDINFLYPTNNNSNNNNHQYTTINPLEVASPIVPGSQNPQISAAGSVIPQNLGIYESSQNPNGLPYNNNGNNNESASTKTSPESNQYPKLPIMSTNNNNNKVTKPRTTPRNRKKVYIAATRTQQKIAKESKIFRLLSIIEDCFPPDMRDYDTMAYFFFLKKISNLGGSFEVSRKYLYQKDKDSFTESHGELKYIKSKILEYGKPDPDSDMVFDTGAKIINTCAKGHIAFYGKYAAIGPTTAAAASSKKSPQTCPFCLEEGDSYEDKQSVRSFYGGFQLPIAKMFSDPNTAKLLKSAFDTPDDKKKEIMG